MAEYIEREAAIKIAECYGLTRGSTIGRHSGIADAISAQIEALPAADVAPVVHGRWIPFHSTHAGDIQYCSACDIGCTWKPDYCPNCGARMDGE